jgi:hypothetical protein
MCSGLGERSVLPVLPGRRRSFYESELRGQRAPPSPMTGGARVAVPRLCLSRACGGYVVSLSGAAGRRPSGGGPSRPPRPRYGFGAVAGSLTPPTEGLREVKAARSVIDPSYLTVVPHRPQRELLSSQAPHGTARPALPHDWRGARRVRGQPGSPGLRGSRDLESSPSFYCRGPGPAPSATSVRGAACHDIPPEARSWSHHACVAARPIWLGWMGRQGA